MPDVSTEELERQFKEKRLSRTGEDTWVLDDAEGRLVIMAFTKSKLMYFFPKTASPVHPIVASLLSKAAATRLDDGDTLEIALPEARLSERGQSGRKSQWLYFSLRNGALIRSAVAIEWDGK